SMPIGVAPTAFHRLACDAGEIATARAAKRAGTLFILSSLSNTAMETVFADPPSLGYSESIREPAGATGAAATSPKWFQLYIYKDRGITQELVQRAERAGAEAIVLTV